MRILYASTWVPPMAGGLQRVAWEIATRVSELPATEVHLLTTGRPGTEKKGSLFIHRIPYVPGLTAVYGTAGLPVLKKMIPKCDIVHVHNPLPWGTVLKSFGKKLVITCHGADIYPEKKQPYRALLDSAMKKADMITTASIFLGGYLTEHYSFRSVLIRNGIDLGKYTGSKARRDARTALFAGRYIKRKGIIELIEAAKSLPDIKFIFVGEGPLRSIIHGRNVFDLGLKREMELIRLYNTATIGVFPSYMENNPMVALEAMACYLPVIGTSYGFPELIRNNYNGLIVEPGNPEQLRAAIKTLIGKPALQEKFSQNSRKVVEKYSWDAIIRQYMNLYKTILSGRPCKTQQ